MRSLRSLLVRSVARLLVASCVVAGLSPAILSLSDGMVSMVAETAYAQAAGTPAAAQPTGQAGSTGTNNGVTTGAELANKGIGVANGIVQAAFMLMNPILMLASWLLSPDWTFGDIFNMRPVLHDLWVLVSNIVYVIFAIALLVIAVLNIFGNQTYQIKSVLPKFVGGIIIVPLSWFIVSAVLSIANVLTASMLNLPYDTFTSNTSLQGNDIIQRIQNYNLPSRCVLDFEKKPATPAAGAGTPASDAESTGETINCGGENGPKVSLSELFSTDGSPYSILYVYAYGIFRVDTLQKITVANSINTASDVVFGLFSGLIGFIIMLLLFIGIVFVLFIRVIQLWVFAILSPLFGLFLFLGENVLGDSSLKKYNIKEFISLAMVPVYISAALSFGLMLVLTVATSTVDPEETTGNSYVQMKTSTDGKEESITIGNNQDPTKRFSLIVKWAPLGLANGVGNAGQIGGGTIGRLVVSILALMILWLAVIAGSKSSEFTASAIEPIESFGKSIGGTVTKLPQYIPIPLGGDQKMSYAGLSSAGSAFQSTFTSGAGTQGSKFGAALGDSVADVMGVETDKTVRDIRAKISASGGLKWNNTQAGSAMDGIITSMTKKWGTFDEAASDSIARGLLAEAIEKMGEVIPDSKVRAELATKIRNAPDATSLQVLLKELDEKYLRGTLGQSNTSAVDWQDITAARNSWTAARNPATTPPAGTPTTAPLAAAFAPNRTALPSGQGTTSTDISAALMTQFDTQYGTGKRQDQTYTKALREWVNTEFNSDHTLRDEVLQKLTSAGGFSFPSN